MAITQNRHVKAGRQRHEKDDREQASDPRNFILGWDNCEKKLRIAAEIERLELVESREWARLDVIAQLLQSLQSRHAATVEALRVTGFLDIDFAVHEREIERLEEERRVIEAGSDSLRLLKQRLVDTDTEEAGLKRRSEQLVGDEREAQLWIAEANRLIDNAEAELRRL